MNKQTLSASDKARILRAMRCAYLGGVDPYNSHARMAAKWQRSMADAVRRGAA